MDLLHIFGELHLPLLALAASVILYSDHHGLAYFRGTQQTLPKELIERLHRAAWVCLGAMILTGVALVIPRWEFLLARPEFYVKMGMVGVLIVNAYAIGTLSKVASERPFTLLSREERHALMLSGTLSIGGWIGAAVIGYFFL